MQTENLRGSLDIRRMNKEAKSRIRETCEVTKWVDERIDECVLRWFSHVEVMVDDRVAKRVYGEGVAQ